MEQRNCFHGAKLVINARCCTPMRIYWKSTINLLRVGDYCHACLHSFGFMHYTLKLGVSPLSQWWNLIVKSKLWVDYRLNFLGQVLFHKLQNIFLSFGFLSRPQKTLFELGKRSIPREDNADEKDFYDVFPALQSVDWCSIWPHHETDIPLSWCGGNWHPHFPFSTYFASFKLNGSHI